MTSTLQTPLCHSSMQHARIASLACAYAQATRQVVAETLWPTRCAVCDAPGALLCDACRLALPYIDHNRSCPRCGAPFGRVQCSECNEVILAGFERTEPPFTTCTSTVTYGAAAARIVRTWKDAGDRALAEHMAALMAAALHPRLTTETDVLLTYVPATGAALRRRGFDHGALLANRVSTHLGVPCMPLLARPRSTDQRALTRKQRLANTAGRFSVLTAAAVPRTLVLVDDVYTTGATLFAACDALREAGVQSIHGLTFARVW